MDDLDVLSDINRLADREHELRAAEEARTLNDAERGELREIEEHLDQCWDLLRQRRARRNAGRDPDEASPRDVGTVEGYRQ